jgi:hypothetical protein
LPEELNALKLTYDESDHAASYESAKSAFFSSLVTSDSEPPSPERVNCQLGAVVAVAVAWASVRE